MGLSDKITDGVASAISGGKIQTVVVTLDEFLNYLKMVLDEVEPEEIPKIEKVVKGSFWTSLKMYDTKNQKYRVSTLYVGTIGSNRLTNEISVMELQSGKIYTCKAFLFKKKIKKAARQLVNQYNR